MASQGIGESKQSELQPLSRENSMYNLTLDEVQNQLGDLGKPLTSMNLQELLKSVWTQEVNQTAGVDIENTAHVNQPSPQPQGSLSVTCGSSKNPLEENRGERMAREKQAREVTLEDFLLTAGVVAEASSEKKNEGFGVNTDGSSSPQKITQAHCVQYQQPYPQQNIMTYQPMSMVGSSVMDVSYPESQVSFPSMLIGISSDLQTSGRTRTTLEETVDKSIERRQKRMIKNRESAARSRARKQAYTNELENKVSRLEEENERLRKQQELEKMLPCSPLPEPKYQLRRTSSSSF